MAAENVRNTNNTQQFTLLNLSNFVSINLNGDNYLCWKHQMLMVLRSLGLQKHIDLDVSRPSAPPEAVEIWTKADCFVSECINATLDPTIAHLALDTNSASDLWKAIGDSYQQQAFAKRSQLKTQFHTIKQGLNSVVVYCDSIKRVCDSLKSIGEKVSDLDLVLQTLQGLNSSYNTCILNVVNTDPPPSFMQLRSRLSLYEERMLQQSEGVPISAMAALKLDNPPLMNFKENKIVLCQICHKQNHTTDRCYFRYDSSGVNKNNRVQGRGNGARFSGNGNWRGSLFGCGSHGGGGNGRRMWNGSPNLLNDAGGFKGGYYCSTDPNLSHGGLRACLFL